MIARVIKPKIVDENASGRLEDRDKGVYVLIPTRLKTEADADNLNALMQEFTATLGKKIPRHLVVDLEGVNLTDGPVSDRFLEALIRARSGMRAMAPVPYAKGELHVAGVGNRDTMGQFQISNLQNKLNVHTEIAAEIVRDLKRKLHTAKRMDRIQLPGTVGDEISR